MNYGLYVSASGMMTNLYRQDVFANNLANVATDGFKARMPVIKQRAAASVENNVDSALSKRMLDRLGGGVLVGPSRVNFAPAPLKQTGHPLDVALPTRNTFFSVRYQRGSGQNRIGLTRDGRLNVNGNGQLVTPAGDAVLDANDQPIVIQGTAPVHINGRGQIIQADAAVGQLGVSKVADTSTLQKVGNNVFAMGPGADPRKPVPNPLVQPGFVERSGVDPIKALMNLMAATKSVSGNAQMVKYQNQMMGAAINQLGKVS